MSVHLISSNLFQTKRITKKSWGFPPKLECVGQGIKLGPLWTLDCRGSTVRATRSKIKLSRENTRQGEFTPGSLRNLMGPLVESLDTRLSVVPPKVHWSGRSKTTVAPSRQQSEYFVRGEGWNQHPRYEPRRRHPRHYPHRAKGTVLETSLRPSRPTKRSSIAVQTHPINSEWLLLRLRLGRDPETRRSGPKRSGQTSVQRTGVWGTRGLGLLADPIERPVTSLSFHHPYLKLGSLIKIRLLETQTKFTL